MFYRFIGLLFLANAILTFFGPFDEIRYTFALIHFDYDHFEWFFWNIPNGGFYMTVLALLVPVSLSIGLIRDGEGFWLCLVALPFVCLIALNNYNYFLAPVAIEGKWEGKQTSTIKEYDNAKIVIQFAKRAVIKNDSLLGQSIRGLYLDRLEGLYDGGFLLTFRRADGKVKAGGGIWRRHDWNKLQLRYLLGLTGAGSFERRGHFLFLNSQQGQLKLLKL